MTEARLVPRRKWERKHGCATVWVQSNSHLKCFHEKSYFFVFCNCLNNYLKELFFHSSFSSSFSSNFDRKNFANKSLQNMLKKFSFSAFVHFFSLKRLDSLHWTNFSLFPLRWKGDKVIVFWIPFYFLEQNKNLFSSQPPSEQGKIFTRI